MLIDDKIKNENYSTILTEKQQKYHALSSGRADKYEYLTGEEILPSDQSRTIEQAKFRYSPLGKAFDKEIKTIEKQGKKQVEALEVLKPNTKKLTIKDAIPENILSEEAKNELNKIKEKKKKERERKFILQNEWIYI